MGIKVMRPQDGGASLIVEVPIKNKDDETRVQFMTQGMIGIPLEGKMTFKVDEITGQLLLHIECKSAKLPASSPEEPAKGEYLN